MDNKIKNGDMPAMPITFTDNMTKLMEQPKALTDWSNIFGGMSKREQFAMAFHAALLTASTSEGEWTGNGASAAEIAVEEADALLKALEANNG